MPIYEYSCQLCDKKWKEMHGVDDKGGKCEGCGNYAGRTIPNARIATAALKEASAGQRVERFIEESREVFREQQAESAREYKP